MRLKNLNKPEGFKKYKPEEWFTKQAQGVRAVRYLKESWGHHVFFSNQILDRLLYARNSDTPLFITEQTNIIFFLASKYSLTLVCESTFCYCSEDKIREALSEHSDAETDPFFEKDVKRFEQAIWYLSGARMRFEGLNLPVNTEKQAKITYEEFLKRKEL